MPERSPRQHWMAVLARAPADDLATIGAAHLPEYTLVRGPEAGLVMVQGRAGGTGAPFNLGEATVVRCTVRTRAGLLGHATCMGRDLRQAELAAALDAALQDPATTGMVQDEVITPLAAAQAAQRDTIARQAAATRVQFFTLATMRG